MRLLLLLLFAGLVSAADRLNVYFVDVEGGQATLVVAPTGQAMLIDAGWNERDAARVGKALQSAGVKRLDYLVVTHYHKDHLGGVPPVAKLVPVGTFLDHGAIAVPYQGSEELMRAYEQAAGTKRRTARPGEQFSLGAVQVTMVTAGAKSIASPMKEGGQRNPVCGTEKAQPDENSENGYSLGMVVTFGKFRLLDLGDILWKQEVELACPVNRIGPVDAYVVTHHGKFTSGPAALVHAVHPAAAIMNNATDKGGSPQTFRILKKSPGLRDIWQLHASVEAAELNSPEALIANPQKDCAGLGLQLSAAADGTFEIRNERTGKPVPYSGRAR